MSQIHRISSEEDKMTIRVDMRVGAAMGRVVEYLPKNEIMGFNAGFGGNQFCFLRTQPKNKNPFVPCNGITYDIQFPSVSHEPS